RDVGLEGLGVEWHGGGAQDLGLAARALRVLIKAVARHAHEGMAMGAGNQQGINHRLSVHEAPARILRGGMRGTCMASRWGALRRFPMPRARPCPKLSACFPAATLSSAGAWCYRSALQKPIHATRRPRHAIQGWRG